MCLIMYLYIFIYRNSELETKCFEQAQALDFPLSHFLSYIPRARCTCPSLFLERCLHLGCGVFGKYSNKSCAAGPTEGTKELPTSWFRVPNIPLLSYTSDVSDNDIENYSGLCISDLHRSTLWTQPFVAPSVLCAQDLAGRLHRARHGRRDIDSRTSADVRPA